MNLEAFFEKFDLFADCPNAVQKMRELILELAVQGKLVELDQGWLVDETKPFSIPSDWEWSSLSRLGEMSGGMTPSKADSSYWDGGVPWFSSKDIKSDELLSSELTISEKGLTETRLRLYPPGCIFIVARSGILKRTLPVSINRVAASVNQDLKVFQPTRDLEIRYIQVALKGLERSILTEYVKTGTTVQSLKYDEFEAMPIPLPPLAEQKRIVAKVDELMALCDVLEGQQKERETKRAQLAKASLAAFADAPSPTSLELLFHPSFSIDPADLRKSILTLAVQGKLVEQRADEAMDEVGLKGSNSDQPFLLPSEWRWTTVNQAGRVDLGRQRSPEHHRGPHMRPYLRVQNVYEARIDISDVKEMNFTPSEYETFVLQDGDILLNEGQSKELVGRPAIYRNEVPGACFQNTLVRFRSFAFVDEEYALVVFRTYLRNGRFQSISKQTTNIAHLSAGRFAALEFPLPPLAEQKRIVAKVDELMALVDRLEAKIVASREAASRLLEAMVAELSGKAA